MTVSVTGFSLAQTGNSLALTAAPAYVFRPSSRLLPSLCPAAALHVIGGKIHVMERVCNKFRHGDNGNNLYNHAVVPVVIVVVYFYFGRQREQPLQPCSCSRCLRCRVFLFWTTTGTTYTTMQLFSLFMLSCIFILDDNGDNLYNHAVVPVVIVVVYFYFGRQREQPIQPCSCSRCYSYRVF